MHLLELPRLVLIGHSLLQLVVAALSWISFPDVEWECSLLSTLSSVQSSTQRELQQLLSRSSSIIGPNDSRWLNATEKYQAFATTHPRLVVQLGHESDIEKVVQYANNNSLDFFVVNRGHSLTTTVQDFSGLQIDVRNLNGITIQPERKTVLLEAGAFNYDVIATLWDQGYITTSGACSCVGMAGPALGGGHGLLQGQYGLISDNIVSMKVVLANGTAITVNETTNTDMWWAMRGAGHNFGIVTSFEMKIYAVGVRTWYYKTYILTGDKLEQLFEILIEFEDDITLPKKLLAGHFGVYTMDTTVSETEAIIAWTFVFAGSQSAAESLLAPFDQLGAVSTHDGSPLYPDLYDALGSGLASEMCSTGKTHIVATAGLIQFNVTAERQIYNLFNLKVAQYPELGNTRVLHEAYSVEGVRNIPSHSSSYPFRDESLLMYFDATPEADSDLDEFSKQWAKETRGLWNAGQPDRPPTTYVNYAFGDESVESIYGYEPWRLERLRAIKAEYDPNNRFGFYNPIKFEFKGMGKEEKEL